MDVDPILFPLVAAGTDGARRKGGAPRAKQQFSTQDFEDSDPVSHAEGDTSGPAEGRGGEGGGLKLQQTMAENSGHVSSNLINNASLGDSSLQS